MKYILAALLHDIGKFYQRTGIKLDNEYYKSYAKNGRSHWHACYTAKFFDENIKISFDNIYELKDESASHHITSSSITQIADRMAAGHDRKDAKQENFFENIENQDSNYKAKRLCSIFNEVQINDKKNTRKYLELSTLNDLKFRDCIEKDFAKEGEKEYLKFYKKFEEEIKEIYKSDIRSYVDLHNLLYPLIKKYTVTIPANTWSDFPTVSLFEHLKLTAAIAGCLEKENLEDEPDDEPFIIFDFDISGIQSFIYRIVEGGDSKDKVAKSLRSRSLYLSLIADFISYYIIDKFKVSYENVLYSTSGRGRLLLPNINGFDELINNICSEIEKTFFELHHEMISVVFSYCKVNGKTLDRSNLSDYTNYENKIFVNKKTQKFKSVLSNKDFSFVLTPKKNLCYMCNIEESDGDLCPFCKKMIELNDNVLAQTDSFIIEYDFANKETISDFEFKVGKLGTIKIHNQKMIVQLSENSYYISINSDKLGETKTYAMSLNKTISFTDIAKFNTGDNKLAVIKMDVDNLGYIFLKGLSGESANNKSDKNTLSKLLNLSRSLDLFFTSLLPKICKEYTYINYAGGDDLVLIVPASKSLDLVEEINKEFKLWTGNNKSFNISAGIDIFDVSSPVRYAILRAGNALEQSKQTEDKNSFTVMEVTLENEELDDINKEIKKYERLIQNNELSRSGVYIIYSALLKSLEYDGEKDVVERYIRYIPLLAYDIHRNIDDVMLQNELKTLLVRKLTYKEIKKYKVIFGYALMNTREETTNELF